MKAFKKFWICLLSAKMQPVMLEAFCIHKEVVKGMFKFSFRIKIWNQVSLVAWKKENNNLFRLSLSMPNIIFSEKIIPFLAKWGNPRFSVLARSCTHPYLEIYEEQTSLPLFKIFRTLKIYIS